MFDNYISSNDMNARVADCARAAQADPVRYRTKLLRLARFGSALVPLISIAVLVPLTIAAVWVWTGGMSTKAQVFVSVFWAYAAYQAVVALLSFRCHSEETEQFELTHDNAPDVLALVEEVRATLDAPHVDRVVLIPDANAYASQVPSGWLGRRHRNELGLGLALMHALTRDELASVIAHELGHISGQHGADLRLVNTTQAVWHAALARAFYNAQIASAFIHLCAKRFLPSFLAHVHAYGRENEYHADRAAAHVVGPQIAADALIRLHALDHIYSEHALVCERLVMKQEEAPRAYYSALMRHLIRAVEFPEVEAVVRRAVHARSSFDDSHPTLGDRLEHLGVGGRLPAPLTVPASRLLGDVYQSALAQFDQEWFDEHQEGWRYGHGRSRSGLEKYAALTERAASGQDLSLDDIMTRGLLARALHKEPEALEIFSTGHQRFPDSARIAYQLGRSLLSAGDNAGLKLLDRAMELDETAVGSACELAMDHLYERNDLDDAEGYRQRALKWDDTSEQLLEKNRQPKRGDVLTTFDVETVDYYREALFEGNLGYAAAYVVSKPLQEWIGGEKTWVVVVTQGVNATMRTSYTAALLQNALHDYDIHAMGADGVGIFVIDPGEEWLLAAIRALPEACLWDRELGRTPFLMQEEAAKRYAETERSEDASVALAA